MSEVNETHDPATTTAASTTGTGSASNSTANNININPEEGATGATATAATTANQAADGVSTFDQVDDKLSAVEDKVVKVTDTIESSTNTCPADITSAGPSSGQATNADAKADTHEGQLTASQRKEETTQTYTDQSKQEESKPSGTEQLSTAASETSSLEAIEEEKKVVDTGVAEEPTERNMNEKKPIQEELENGEMGSNGAKSPREESVIETDSNASMEDTMAKLEHALKKNFDRCLEDNDMHRENGDKPDYEKDMSQVDGYQAVPDGCPDWKRAMLERKNQQLVDSAKKNKAEKDKEKEKWKGIPEWKKALIMDREKRKDDEQNPQEEEIRKRKDEEMKIQNMPEWKRVLYMKKKTDI